MSFRPESARLRVSGTIVPGCSLGMRVPAGPFFAQETTMTNAFRPCLSGLLVVCSLLLSVPATPARAQWTVTNLHPAGAINSRATGGSGGTQVGYVQVGPTVGHYRASLWTGTAASWVNLHPAGTVYSIGYGGAGANQVGEVYTDGLPRASIWSGSSGTWINLHPAGPWTNSSAFNMADGQQVGRTYAGGYNAALWSGSAASWVNLNPLPHPVSGYVRSSEALGVSGGKQVGYVIDAGNKGAALWSGSAASWVSLHPPQFYESTAWGAGGGQQVGQVRNIVTNQLIASLWSGSAASWVSLQPAGTNFSNALAASGGRQVGNAYIGGSYHASLWSGTAASWVDLSTFLPAGFTRSEASAIWSDGTTICIAGYGFNSIFQRDEALLWTNRAPCKGDLNGDGLVDDSDFSPFAVAYNILDCADPAMPAGCPSDLNGDGLVDDLDFQVFLVAYNALVCP